MTFRIRDMSYDAGEAMPRHAHDELQISILLRGTMREEAGGVVYEGRAGDIIIKPAGVMHANTFGAARIVCLDTVDELPFRGYAWHRISAATPVAMRVTKRYLDGEDVSEDIDELLAALPSPVRADRVLATRAARMLDDAFPAMPPLARELGVHRVYLARVFRLQWGCSPRDYVQQLRVRAAAHRLASTMHALADIALDCGFSDQPHMSRVFRRCMGLTPAAFRRMARA